MAGKTRPCPQCGGKMSFRLGEYQCTSCDYTELQSPREEAPAGGRSMAQRWQPPGAAPQAPPSPSAFIGTGQSGSEGMPHLGYGAGALWEEAKPEHIDSLLNEKHVYFAVSVVLTLLYMVSNAITGAMMGAQAASGAAASGSTAPPVGLTMTSMLGGSLFIYGVALLLTWWVLYSKEVWAKWSCIGCTGIYLAMLVLGTMGILSLLQISSTVSNTPEAGIARGLFIFMMLVNIAWYGWFVSILYRDARQLG